MANENLYIVGTGGFGREVLFLIHELGLFDNVKAFLEPDTIWEKSYKDVSIMDKPILPMSDYVGSRGSIVIGIGDPNLRSKTSLQLPGDTRYASLFHPSARISKWATFEEGAIVTAGCIVTTQIKVGKHCHLNLNTTIGHDCNIGDFYTTAPAVNISGDCNIGNSVYFGGIPAKKI